MDTEILLDHRPWTGPGPHPGAATGPEAGPIGSSGDGPPPGGPPDGSRSPDDAASAAHHLVRILLRISGKPPAAGDRTPLNLSLVLDRSGSMAGRKLEAATEAAADLLRSLHPDDVASVVAYDHRVRMVAEPGRGEEQGRIADALRLLRPGGSTNLSGGWLKGRDLVSANLVEDGVNRIVLLSDGLANDGITDPVKLMELCSEAREKGVSTTTVGIGEGFDEDLMRGMADAGGGSTYYVERPDQAGAIFAEELEGLVSIAAQNLEIEVRPGAAATLGRVRHGYPREETATGLRLLPGDLYAREPVPVLVEMIVPADPDEAEVEVATLTVRADVLTPGGGVEKRTVELPVRFSPAEGASVDPEVQRESLLQDAARAREQALEAHDLGDLQAASETLRSTVQRLRESGLEDPDLVEEAADLDMMASQAETADYSVSDLKYMKQRAYEASTGRSYRKELYRRTERSPESSPAEPDSESAS